MSAINVEFSEKDAVPGPVNSGESFSSVKSVKDTFEAAKSIVNNKITAENVA